jgi:hypothetical protein
MLIKTTNYESIPAKKMVRHIIMFKLKEFESQGIKKQKLTILKKMIDELGNQIKEIDFIEAGINNSSREMAYDLVLVSDFKNPEDLEPYRIHPEHKKVVEFLKEIKLSSAVVDYTY